MFVEVFRSERMLVEGDAVTIRKQVTRVFTLILLAHPKKSIMTEEVCYAKKKKILRVV